MNSVAWSRRWTDRIASQRFAESANDTAKEGAGRRSRVQQGEALRTLAWHARWRGALDEAMAHALGAEAFLPERDHPETRAVLYAILASIHFAKNRFDLAASSLERGFWLVQDMAIEDVHGPLVELLLTRATLQRHSGERARAGITLGRAAELADREELPAVEYCTALWLYTDGDPAAARGRASHAMEVAVEDSTALIIPYLHGVLGACDTKLGRYSEARDHLDSALCLAMEVEDLRLLCFLYRFLTHLHVEEGNLDQALEHIEKAARLAKEQKHAFERKRIALIRAELYERQGEYRKAVQQHNLAWRLQNETRMI